MPPTKRQLDPGIVTVFFPDDGQPHRGINKFGNLSRWVINDLEYDDLQNFIPMEGELQQVPGNSATIATLVSSAIWMSAQPLNLATYLYCLCANGHIYQISLGGTITDVSGATSMSSQSDICSWQGTQVLFSDVQVSKIYSWNGTTFATVFSGQPANFITVYNARLWMANNQTISFTAGGTYNSLGGDAGSFVITDSDCPAPVRALVPYGGNLFVFGYSWVKVYGGLFDQGSPAVLQFQQSTLTDEAGVINKWGIVPLGYSVYYAHLNGVWNLLGSQPSLVSEPVGGFFQYLTLAGTSFSAAFGWILGMPVLMWQVQYATDSSYRILCMTYDTNPQRQLWFTLSLGPITFITYGIDQTNGQQKVWGIDTSNNIVQIASNTIANVTSKVSTKLWSFGTRIRKKTIIRAGIEAIVTSSTTVALNARDENLNTYSPDLQSANPQFIFVWNNGSSINFTWTNGASGTFTWNSRGTQYQLLEFDLPIAVRKLGLDVTFSGSGGVIGAFGIEFQELPADWGA